MEILFITQPDLKKFLLIYFDVSANLSQWITLKMFYYYIYDNVLC